MNKKKAKKRRQSGLRDVLPVVFAMGCSGLLCAYGAFYILVKTGPWCVPLLLSYLALLMLPSAFFLSHREKQNLHFQMGHELFYRENPRVLKRALAKARRKGIPEEKKALLAQYAALPLKPAPPLNEKTARERRIWLMLYDTAGLLLLILAGFLLFRGITLGQLINAAPKSSADYTPLLLYGQAAAVLAVSLFLFLKKKPRFLRAAALLIMLFASWALWITFSVSRLLALKDVLMNLGLCLVYAIIAYALPAPAGDVRSPEKIRQQDRDFQLALFELDIISEEDLKYRLT